MANSVEYSLKKAKNMLSRGQLEEAEKAFKSILISFPGNLRARDGLNYCEMMKDQQINDNDLSDVRASITERFSAGDHTKVIELFEEIFYEDFEASDILIKAGASYGLTGDFQKSHKCFEKVISLHPEDPAPWNNIGTIYKMQDDIQNAMAYYSEALNRNPKHFDSLKNMAFCLEQSKQLEKACEFLEAAIEVDSTQYNLLNHLAGLYFKLEIHEKAEICHTALELKPDFTPSINNLGNIYFAQQKYEKAINQYEKALEINPAYGDAYNNLANVLKDMGYLDEAIFNYEKSIELQPQKAELYSNLSVALKDKHEITESLEKIEEAIALKKDFYDAYWNKALALLAGKNYSDGWKSYEWRWKATNFDSTYLETNKPLWSGKKERVLVWQEQGIGDQIMFSTLFEEFAELCSLAIFQVDARLLPIFRRTFPQFHFIPGDKKLSENEYDSHIPMGSLPKYLRDSDDKFKRANPTRLKADLSSAQKIRQAFRIGEKCLIGIS